MQFFEDIQLGDSRESPAFEVAEAHMITFAREWDPQPFHIDKEYAATTELGLIASGMYTTCIALRLAHDLTGEPVAVVAGLGWDELRFYHPVRTGDRLHVRSQTVGKRKSKGQPHRGIVTSTIQLLNQEGVIVLSLKISALVRCQ